jgi:hypothetical protein
MSAGDGVDRTRRRSLRSQRKVVDAIDCMAGEARGGIARHDIRGSGRSAHQEYREDTDGQGFRH